MKNHFDTIDQVNNLREIQALRRLSPHAHIITLEEVLYDQPTGRLALVFELMDANLYEVIRGRRQYLHSDLIQTYIFQLLHALDHMHCKGIFHRDIKPENILIESCCEGLTTLKLADFGSCRGIYSKQPYTEYISTRWYRAPECLLTDGYYGPEMDLWGAGCVFFEITSLYPLFPGTNELDQINRIHKVIGTPSMQLINKFRTKSAAHVNFDFQTQPGIGIRQLVKHCSSSCLDLMIQMLLYDAAVRISAREALCHHFFVATEGVTRSHHLSRKMSQRTRVDAEVACVPIVCDHQTTQSLPDINRGVSRSQMIPQKITADPRAAVVRAVHRRTSGSRENILEQGSKVLPPLVGSTNEQLLVRLCNSRSVAKKATITRKAKQRNRNSKANDVRWHADKNSFNHNRRSSNRHFRNTNIGLSVNFRSNLHARPNAR
eukprot:CAMPEP_0197387142 /NCGR_PEP_ID=MMETSP1165-20131217/348_1 /TAXON_ID=284809 /ORGANISM="Chrysocystis fragilis, Strain CCMP3189" /LENGTH=432 /DNA_ID=CAMNT_0042912449 /DNA_START=192 /DNA_END=1490 /DNA_ORIENTATION=+